MKIVDRDYHKMHNNSMKEKKIGIIDTSKLRVLPEKHEYETARYFADRGHDIEFIPPSNSPNMRTPDFK